MENCPEHRAIEERIQSLKDSDNILHDNHRTIATTIGELRERINAVESSSKSAHHRLDEISNYSELVIKMSVSFETYAKSLDEYIRSDKEEKNIIKSDIEDLKHKNGESASKILWIIVVAGVTAIIGLLISKVIE